METLKKAWTWVKDHKFVVAAVAVVVVVIIATSC